VRDIRQILEESETIAVVGASRNPSKSAYSVPAALQSAGFTIIPVNAHAEEIHGEKAYPNLEAIGHPVDVVQVFRPSEEAPGIARSAAAIGAKALWLQLGLHSDEARQLAEDAGMDYVEDHCMGVERAKFGVIKAKG